jgi:hypothetical protein
VNRRSIKDCPSDQREFSSSVNEWEESWSAKWLLLRGMLCLFGGFSILDVSHTHSHLTPGLYARPVALISCMMTPGCPSYWWLGMGWTSDMIGSHGGKRFGAGSQVNDEGNICCSIPRCPGHWVCHIFYRQTGFITSVDCKERHNLFSQQWTKPKHFQRSRPWFACWNIYSILFKIFMPQTSHLHQLSVVILCVFFSCSSRLSFRLKGLPLAPSTWR